MDAVIVAISAIVIAIFAVFDLVRIITTHSGLEVTDAFTKTFGDIRYPSSAEQDDDNYRDD